MISQQQRLSAALLSLITAGLALCGALSPAQTEAKKLTKPLDYREGTGATKGGPSYDHPMIWRAQCPELPALHLVGTMHIPDARFANLSPQLLKVIDESDAVYGELDLSDKAALSAELTPHMLLSGGETLESKLPPELYKQLKRYLELKGSNVAMFGMMKPEAIELTLSMIELLPLFAQGLPGLDDVILQRALERGKQVGGVETVQEQIKAIFSKTPEESIESLRHTLKRLFELHERGVSPHDALMKAFFSGDAEALQLELLSELKGAPPSQLKLFERLLNQRNVLMAKRIIKLVRSKKGAFVFAFGAAHFIGPHSVNQLLEGQGCKVERSR